MDISVFGNDTPVAYPEFTPIEPDVITVAHFTRGLRVLKAEAARFWSIGRIRAVFVLLNYGTARLDKVTLFMNRYTTAVGTLAQMGTFQDVFQDCRWIVNTSPQTLLTVGDKVGVVRKLDWYHRGWSACMSAREGIGPEDWQICEEYVEWLRANPGPPEYDLMPGGQTMQSNIFRGTYLTQIHQDDLRHVVYMLSYLPTGAIGDHVMWSTGMERTWDQIEEAKIFWVNICAPDFPF